MFPVFEQWKVQTVELLNVLLVPQLSENLISVSAATQHGLEVHFENLVATISERTTTGERRFIEARLDGGIF